MNFQLEYRLRVLFATLGAHVMLEYGLLDELIEAGLVEASMTHGVLTESGRNAWLRAEAARLEAVKNGTSRMIVAIGVFPSVDGQHPACAIAACNDGTVWFENSRGHWGRSPIIPWVIEDEIWGPA